jgi:type IV fimbrial biogenesis protein FimT
MLALNHRHSTSPAMRGFTLIELMVAIAIAAILMVVAAPSFVAFQRNSELTSASNSLLSAINAARSEAMKRNFNAMVTPTDGSDWKNGWTVFVDSNMNGSLDTSDVVIFRKESLPAYFDIRGTNTADGATPYMLFNGSGYAMTTARAPVNLALIIQRNDLSGVNQLAQTRLLLVAVTGRARVCKPATSADADCTSTDGS